MLPKGFAAAAAAGEPILSGLESPEIVHEWTTKVGKKLLERLSERFKEALCGKSGLDQMLEKKNAAEVAEAILTFGLVNVTFWAPLAVLIAVVLLKRD